MGCIFHATGGAPLNMYMYLVSGTLNVCTFVIRLGLSCKAGEDRLYNCSALEAAKYWNKSDSAP